MRGRIVLAELPARAPDVPTDAEIEAAMRLPLTDEIQECETCCRNAECWQKMRETGRFYFASCNPREPINTMKAKVVAALETRGAMSTLELMDALNAKQHGVYSVLKRMRAAGEVVDYKRHRANGVLGIEKVWRLTQEDA